MRTRLVVTGALGHIGSRLIRTISPDRYSEVVLIDDLSTQRYCSLFDLPAGVPFRFIEADICDADLEPLFAGASAVVHLAAVTDATSSFAHQERVKRVNVFGTERVARTCVAVDAPLIFPSTTSVYGTAERAVDEGCSATELRPQSPYAESKLGAEQLLAGLRSSGGLRFVILRLGTIVGVSPGMRFHTAVNKFAWQACAGEPITVWRTAMHQVRPYLDLEDAVRALTFAIDEGLSDGGTYNVLTANVSVSEIVDSLRPLVPDLRVQLVDAEIMNQLSFEVRSDRFRSRGFAYTRTLQQGITETVRLLSYRREEVPTADRSNQPSAIRPPDN